MHCLFGCFALMLPRVALVVAFLFERPMFERAYETILWPVLGFFFMPLTTLAYAWAASRTGTDGLTHGISGYGIALVIFAALVDFGLLGSKKRSRRRSKDDD
jgi:hypothetical protein